MAAGKLKISREGLLHLDMQGLMLDDRFKRFLFTTLSDAGIFTGCFHSADAVLAFGEGRRSLGLDILSTAAKALGSREEALAAILAVEIKTQMETKHDNRDRNQYRNDRNRELGSGTDDDDGSDDD